MISQRRLIYTSALQSFGMDDTLCASVGAGKAPATARTWVHRNTIVLGIQDTKLPFLQEGRQFLAEQGLSVDCPEFRRASSGS